MKGARIGEVIRVLPHGTVMVWDLDAKRGFPYYGRDRDLGVGTRVQFTLNRDATIIEDLRRAGQ